MTQLPHSSSSYDVCIIGGAGHIGAPLGIVLASRGIKTLICDINQSSLETLASGKLPFLEEYGEEHLKKALEAKKLGFTSDHSDIKGIPIIVLTIGTPVDEFHNPVFSLISNCLNQLLPFLSDDQTLILRSTVAPGTCNFLDNYLKQHGKQTKLAFCPERVVQGKAIEEIQNLPQLVSGTSPEAEQIAKNLFSKIAPEIVELSPSEAEFAKLICNAYRYIQFAATNQLYMMVESAGVNYQSLLEKMKRGYPRMQSIPGPGFAAGPCLMKDTMQLASFGKQDFMLGQMSMLINEGLPNYLVENLTKKRSLKGTSVGILGMAFKADSDDIRDSLSYKLLKILKFHGAIVQCSDEFYPDETFKPATEVIEMCDIIIIGVPHTHYKTLKFRENQEIVDLWGATNSSSS